MQTDTHRPTIFPAYAHEASGTRTRQREARRAVRTSLGTSSDAPPTLAQVLDAVEALRRLVDMTSGSRYGLAIVRSATPDEDTQTREVEGYTFGAHPGVIFTGTRTRERSSQIHEPVTETRRREKALRGPS
jgi:hypothetical protein